MNKKGITPIIAVVLLLMMTVAAAGAAFYWLTRMQQQAQSGVTGRQQQLLEESSAEMTLLAQNYNETGYIITADIQNTGGTSISRAAPDIIMTLEDGDGDAVCDAETLAGTNFPCTSGCAVGADIAPNAVQRFVVTIDNTACPMTSGNTYYYQFRFRKGASVAGSIIA